MFVLRRLFWKFLFSLFVLGSVGLWASPSFLGQFSMFGRYGTVQGGAGGEVEGSFGALRTFGYVGGYGNIGWNQEGLNHRLGALFARSEKWGGGMMWRTYGEWDGAQLSKYARGQFVLGGSLRWRALEGWVNVYPFIYGKERAEQDLNGGKLDRGALLLPTERWKAVRNYTDIGGRAYIWQDRFYVGARGKLQGDPEGGIGFGGDGLFGMQMPLWGPVGGRVEAVTGYDTANGFVVKARVGIRYLLGKKMPSITALPMVERPYEAFKTGQDPLVDKGGQHQVKTTNNFDELVKLFSDPRVKTVVLGKDIKVPAGQSVNVPYGVNLAGGGGSVVLSNGHVVRFNVVGASPDVGFSVTEGQKAPLVRLWGDSKLSQIKLNAKGGVAIGNHYDETNGHDSVAITLKDLTITDGFVDLRAGQYLKKLAVLFDGNAFVLTGIALNPLPIATTKNDLKTPIAALIQLVAEGDSVIALTGAKDQTLKGKMAVGQTPLGILAVGGNVEVEKDATLFKTVKEEGGNLDFSFAVASVGAKDRVKNHSISIAETMHVNSFQTLFWAGDYTSTGLGNSDKGEFGFNASLGTINVTNLGGNHVFARNFLTATPGSRVDGNVRVGDLKVKTWTPDTEHALLNLSGLVIDGVVDVTVTPVAAITSEDTFFDLHGAKIGGMVVLAGSFVAGTTLRNHSLVNLQGVSFNEGSVDLGGLDFSNVALTIGTAGAPAAFNMTKMTGSGTVTFGKFGKLKLGTFTFSQPAVLFDLSETKANDNATITVNFPIEKISGFSKKMTIVSNMTFLSLRDTERLTLIGTVNVNAALSNVPIVSVDGHNEQLNADGLQLYVTKLPVNVPGILLAVGAGGDVATFTGASSLPVFYPDLDCPDFKCPPFENGSSLVRFYNVKVEGMLEADFSHVAFYIPVRFGPLTDDQSISLFKFDNTTVGDGIGAANFEVTLPAEGLPLNDESNAHVHVVNADVFTVKKGSTVNFTTKREDGKPGELTVEGTEVAAAEGKGLFHFSKLTLEEAAVFNAFGVQVYLYAGEYGAGSGIVFSAGAGPGNFLKLGAKSVLDLPRLTGLLSNVKVTASPNSSLYTLANISVTDVADVKTEGDLPQILFGHRDAKGSVAGDPGMTWDKIVWGGGDGMLIVDGGTAAHNKTYQLVYMTSTTALPIHVRGLIKPGGVTLGANKADTMVTMTLPKLAALGRVDLGLDWTELLATSTEPNTVFLGVRVVGAEIGSKISLDIDATSTDFYQSADRGYFNLIAASATKGTLEIRDLTSAAVGGYDWSPRARLVRTDGGDGSKLTAGKLVYHLLTKKVGQYYDAFGPQIQLTDFYAKDYVVEVSTDQFTSEDVLDKEVVRINLQGTSATETGFAGTLKLTGTHWKSSTTAAGLTLITQENATGDLLGKIEVQDTDIAFSDKTVPLIDYVKSLFTELYWKFKVTKIS